MIFLIEFSLILGAIYLALTQIVVPAVNGRKWFPMFHTEAALLGEYTELTQAEYEASLREKNELKKQNLNNTKGEEND